MAEEALSKSAEVRLEVIRTRGDEARIDPHAGRKGLFTAELESALLAKRIDVAVHSAKDLPGALHKGTTIAAVLVRGPVEDLLVTKSPMQFAALPRDATIATGSVRRQRQVRWLDQDIRLVDLRGNVPTRLRKFAASDWDAIILARAGLARLGFSPPQFTFEARSFFAEILPLEKFVPAGGQGVIALQTRASDSGALEIAASADDRETHACLRAEREFLRLLQGDCNSPVGAHACFREGEIELRVQIFGNVVAPKMASARGTEPEKVAAEVFEKIEHGHDYEHEHE